MDKEKNYLYICIASLFISLDNSQKKGVINLIPFFLLDLHKKDEHTKKDFQVYVLHYIHRPIMFLCLYILLLVQSIS